MPAFLRMLQAGSPGGGTNVPTFPARTDDPLTRSPWRNFASGPENRMRAFPGLDSKQGSSPDRLDVWGFCQLGPRLVWGFSAPSAKTASRVCLKSGLWEGDPREHERGLSGYQSPN